MSQKNLPCPPTLNFSMPEKHGGRGSEHLRKKEPSLTLEKECGQRATTILHRAARPEQGLRLLPRDSVPAPICQLLRLQWLLWDLATSKGSTEVNRVRPCSPHPGASFPKLEGPGIPVFPHPQTSSSLMFTNGASPAPNPRPGAVPPRHGAVRTPQLAFP